MENADNSTRCPWCGTDPLYVHYHDTDWGVPEYDSRALFEKLLLDGFQAGLAWITILRKRDAFRAAFSGFDPDLIATWGESEVARLLQMKRAQRSNGDDGHKCEGTQERRRLPRRRTSSRTSGR